LDGLEFEARTEQGGFLSPKTVQTSPGAHLAAPDGYRGIIGRTLPFLLRVGH